ncbi:MAG: DUF2185 domain-containing protein [Bacteroidia bacterium]|nr:DUF2185 domain-containing protein [Bacteroidia bacterium]
MYTFSEPQNTACFTCDHVINKKRPILSVTHDAEDGSWQFMCGHDDHDESNAKVVSLKQITEIDNTINALSNMPLGCGADRESGNDEWQGYRLSE